MGCRYLLGTVFSSAAISKITDLQGFTDRVMIHSGLPYSVGMAVAVWLPWLELTCAACLLLGRAVREAALIVSILLILFIGYAVIHWGQPDCGCLMFPALGFNGSRWWPAVRDALLLLACFPVLRRGF